MPLGVETSPAQDQQHTSTIECSKNTTCFSSRLDICRDAIPPANNTHRFQQREETLQCMQPHGTLSNVNFAPVEQLPHAATHLWVAAWSGRPWMLRLQQHC
jgi:hypothetical protein